MLFPVSISYLPTSLRASKRYVQRPRLNRRLTIAWFQLKDSNYPKDSSQRILPTSCVYSLLLSLGTGLHGNASAFSLFHQGTRRLGSIVGTSRQGNLVGVVLACGKKGTDERCWVRFVSDFGCRVHLKCVHLMHTFRWFTVL